MKPGTFFLSPSLDPDWEVRPVGLWSEGVCRVVDLGNTTHGRTDDFCPVHPTLRSFSDRVPSTEEGGDGLEERTVVGDDFLLRLPSSPLVPERLPTDLRYPFRVINLPGSIFRQYLGQKLIPLVLSCRSWI